MSNPENTIPHINEADEAERRLLAEIAGLQRLKAGRAATAKSLVEAARVAYDLGYWLLPCGLDKQPVVKWLPYQTRRPALDLILEFCKYPATTCLAAICGPHPDLIILDFDCAEGIDTMKKLGLEPHIRTPRGGFHVHVRHPPSFELRTWNDKSVRKLAEAFPSMDVRATGGYGIICGHSRDGAYQWL
jgi:hypothetical protein